MTFGEIAVLGIVQGITEFLPVSSSGHLVLARLLFSIPDVAGTATDAFLHLGTLLAVLVYYWKVWWGIGRGIFVRDAEGNDKRQLLGKLLVATIPGGLVGYLWADVIEAQFRDITAVAIGFAITGIVLIIAETMYKRDEHSHRASWRQAIVIGIAQAVALVPGISRSGMTIAAGRAQGLTRPQAVHFSFLLSVPIIAGAGVGTLPALLEAHTYPVATLLIGFFVSFIAGLAAVHALVRMTRTVSFVPFAVYLFAVSALLLLLF